jgi:hypothetical protein
MGSKFAPVAGSNAVTQFDKGSNVKFRANKLRNRLALDGQVRSFEFSVCPPQQEHRRLSGLQFACSIPTSQKCGPQVRSLQVKSKKQLVAIAPLNPAVR